MRGGKDRKPAASSGGRKSKSWTRPGDPQSLGAALSQLIALKGLANSRGDAQLAETWKNVAGERIADRTVVLGVHRGVLQIGVVSSAMMNELAAFHKGRLVEELKDKHAELKVKDIKFRLRGDLAKPSETPANHTD